jgi:hypothetical protein
MSHLKPASIVSFVLWPSSFSSRLIRVAAADKPMNSANIGSATLEMRCVGEGIVTVLGACFEVLDYFGCWWSNVVR